MIDHSGLSAATHLSSMRSTFEQIWASLATPKGTRETAARIATGRKVYERGRATKTVQRTVDKPSAEGLRQRARVDFQS